MDGLINVAEAIRKDVPKNNTDLIISSPSKSRILLSDADKEHETTEVSGPSTKRATVDANAEVKANISELGALEGRLFSNKDQDTGIKLHFVTLLKCMDITELDYAFFYLIILSYVRIILSIS